MDRVIYVAMSGAKQALEAQASHNQNLANVATAGFRAALAGFRSMPVYGPGHPSRVYAMTERTGVNFSAGPITETGNDLDVAIKGDGWIAVQGPDGREAYTRAGNLRIESGGTLVTGAGHGVMGDGGPIAIPPAEKIEIGADGTIGIRPTGELPSTLVEAGRIKLVKLPTDQIEKGLDGLMHLKDGRPAEADATVQLVSGAIEGSNFNAVDALVDLVQVARLFELQVKVMRAAEENDRAATQMMRTA